ncbi:hypothetical protein L484_023241 [Morus notabilis]|uniref:Uncharacterized protein n=1 Tax=Morus notabilis TaxID=981085 RepID=W9RW94_9ROSA|nr:hypothetical protein L484_023241 [Morus notabilis]
MASPKFKTRSPAKKKRHHQSLHCDALTSNSRVGSPKTRQGLPNPSPEKAAQKNSSRIHSREREEERDVKSNKGFEYEDFDQNHIGWVLGF